MQDSKAFESVSSKTLTDAEQAEYQEIDPNFVSKRLTEVGVPSTGFEWKIDKLLSDTDEVILQLNDEQFHDWVKGEVSEQIAAEMRLSIPELDVNRPLAEMGVDSILKMVIAHRLEKRFKVPFSTSLSWKYPTINALTTYFAKELKSKATVDSKHTLKLGKSAEIQSKTLDINGAKLNYEISGSGPSLFFIPGGAAD